MSWPTDGEPRFVVREHTGYPMPRGTGQAQGHRSEGLSVRVVDRAYNHRTVLSWASEDERGFSVTRAAKFERMRERAAREAARLNALAR